MPNYLHKCALWFTDGSPKRAMILHSVNQVNQVNYKLVITINNKKKRIGA